MTGEGYEEAVSLALRCWEQRSYDRVEASVEDHIRALFLSVAHLITFNGEPEFCPYDCDYCHGEDCPCDRLGCDGHE